jgi:hypothetical protein
MSEIQSGLDPGMDVRKRKLTPFNENDYIKTTEDRLLYEQALELERLRAIERAAREVLLAGEATCGEDKTLEDLYRFKLAMDALSAALEAK